MPQKLPDVTEPLIVRVAGSIVTSASLEPTRPALVRTSIVDLVPLGIGEAARGGAGRGRQLGLDAAVEAHGVVPAFGALVAA